MSGEGEIWTYNFAVFEGTESFLPFRSALPVGTAAADFPVILPETGGEARLSDYWRERDLLIEFGSLT